MNNLLTNLSLASITPSPNNPRKVFAAEAMAELVASVKTHGVVQPILVRQLEAGDYELIAGERRYRAATEAMLDTIPAMVVHASEQEALELSIIENLQRQDISAMEEAEGYQRWLTLSGLGVDALIGKLDKSRSYVYGTIKLLELTGSVADRVRSGAMSRSVALLLSRINDAAKQEDLARKVMDVSLVRGYEQQRPMTYREALKFVSENATLSLTRSIFDLDAEYGNLIPCSTCPKRSCNDMLILAEHDNNPDVCTDPTCHQVKTERHLEPQIQALKDAGSKVIVGPNIPGGYKPLDQYVGGRRGLETIKKLLGKKLLPKPETYAMSTFTGKATVIISDKVLKQILADNDLGPDASSSNSSTPAMNKERNKKWHESVKYQVAVRHRCAEAAWRGIFDSSTPDFETITMIFANVFVSENFPDLDGEPSERAKKLLSQTLTSLDSPASNSEGSSLDYREIFDRISSAKYPQVVCAALLEPWLSLSDERHSDYWMNDSVCIAFIDSFGLTLEITQVDRDAADKEWPAPAATPAEAFDKLFSGDKIRKPSKKKAKAAKDEQAPSGDDGTPIERPLEELYPDKTNPPGPGYYWNEISGRWAIDLSHNPEKPEHLLPARKAWTFRAGRYDKGNSPGPGFAWSEADEQWKPAEAPQKVGEEV